MVSIKKHAINKHELINTVNIKEAGCAVLEALEKGEIHPSRHKSYVRLYEHAKEIKDWEK